MQKLLSVTLATVLTGSLYASDISELESKIDALIEEVETLKVSKTDSRLSSYYGLGDAASRVYKSGEKLSIGGYGHTDYLNNQGVESDTVDNYRAIIYLGYSFSDRIKFQSEIEFEHSNQLAVEFAALDFMINDRLNVRTGNFIIPVGHINLRHEPTLFLNVSRPDTEKHIIPATWHENGLMLYGQYGNFEYQFATTASMDANNGATVRDMRESASKSAANDFGYSARLTYKPLIGLELTASLFTGQTDQGTQALEGASVTISEAHILYNANNVRFTALYAQTLSSSADKIALFHGTNAASKSNGYYMTLGYAIGQWTPFVHLERYDRFAAGYDATGTKLFKDEVTEVVSVGLNFRPHEQIVIKADYMDQETAGVDEDRFSMGIGYIF